MYIFPELNQNQVVVLKADHKTGHILTTKEKIYTGNEEKIFEVFESVIDARHFITEVQNRNKSIDCSIFNFKNILIDFFPALSVD